MFFWQGIDADGVIYEKDFKNSKFYTDRRSDTCGYGIGISDGG